MYFLKKKKHRKLTWIWKKKSLWITSKVYSRTHGESGVSLRHKRIKKCLAKNNTAECIFLKSENLSSKEIEKLSNNFFFRNCKYMNNRNVHYMYNKCLRSKQHECCLKKANLRRYWQSQTHYHKCSPPLIRMSDKVSTSPFNIINVDCLQIARIESNYRIVWFIRDI